MLSLLKRYRELIVVSALLLYPLATFLARGPGGRDPNVVDRAVIWVTAPLQRWLGAAMTGVGSTWSGYVGLYGVKEENDRLLQENATLRSRVQALGEADLENQRLRRLLMYADEQIGREVAARVIGVNPVTFPLAVRIDRGSDEGIQKGAAVITADGVVGQVVRVTGGYADVMLVRDPNARIAVRVQRTRARATAAGAGGDQNLALEYLLRTEAVAVGDVIVTAGTDGVFPPGLLVGSVTAVQEKASGMFQAAEVIPAVDTVRLEEVLVLPAIDWNAAAAAAARIPLIEGDAGVPVRTSP